MKNIYSFFVITINFYNIYLKLKNINKYNEKIRKNIKFKYKKQINLK